MDNEHLDDQLEGGYVASAAGSISPADLARAFVRRPGMYVGEANFRACVSWLRGFDDALAMRDGVAMTEGMARRPTSVHAELLQMPAEDLSTPDDERTALLRLEPLAAALFAEARQAR